MTYLDKDHNEIGETIGEVRGWIEGTKYTGELFFKADGYQPVKCSWQFARQWFQSVDDQEQLSDSAFMFVRTHGGDVE